MIILYIFPHPDDESFGPAAAIRKQLDQGHEVHLLTLTKGGATKVRHTLGLNVAEMGEVRYEEMLQVKQVLQLSSLSVLDFPDGMLAQVDPLQLETAVKNHLLSLKANIVVAYPVHGISGFHDHLVTHAIVKRVFCELKASGNPHLKRLAMFTISEAQHIGFQKSAIPITFTPDERISVRTPLSEDDRMAMQQALACYTTYQDTIRKTVGTAPPMKEVVYELFGEHFNPPLQDITDQV
jgi:LmbE family N-acetylglucosaminyl deacetylase